MSIVFNMDHIMEVVRVKQVQRERHIAVIPESTETAYAPTMAEALHKLKNHPFTIQGHKRYVPGSGSWLTSSQYIYWDIDDNGMGHKVTEVV